MKIAAGIVVAVFFAFVCYTMVASLGWWAPFAIWGTSLLVTACIMVLVGCEKDDFIDLWK